jgi:hypothetical protein
MIYNIESLLEAENDGLKGAVKARDEHIDSLRQLCSFWSTSTNLLHHPFVVEILKILTCHA